VLVAKDAPLRVKCRTHFDRRRSLRPRPGESNSARANDEGRVDRFGQKSKSCPGAHLLRRTTVSRHRVDVLLRRHNASRDYSESPFPVPVDSNAVVEAISRASTRGREENALELRPAGADDERDEFHDGMAASAERESRSAQSLPRTHTVTRSHASSTQSATRSAPTRTCDASQSTRFRGEGAVVSGIDPSRLSSMPQFLELARSTANSESEASYAHVSSLRSVTAHLPGEDASDRRRTCSLHSRYGT